MSKIVHDLGPIVPPPDLRLAPATVAEVRAMRAEGPHAIVPIAGDCMERSGIEDGGWVAVDFTRLPRTPKYGKGGYIDPCLCLAAPMGRDKPTVMVKAYIGKWGRFHTVSTRYDNWKGGDYRMDAGLCAHEIFGVVFASWDRDGALKWERDPAEFPERLDEVPSIHGDNGGEPMEGVVV